MSFSSIPYLTKPKPGVMLNPLHPLSRGLVGYWLFNEGAGSRAADISGYGNHGTLMNMSPNAQNSGWGGSKFGGGLNFDGSGGYVDIPECIFGPDNSTFEAIFMYHPDAKMLVGNSGDNDTYIYFVSAIEIKVQTDVAPGTTFTVPTMIANEYYHLIVTRKSNTMRLYLDGAESPTGGAEQTADMTIDQIGRYGDGLVGWFWVGEINFISLRNRALSPPEVKQLNKDPFCNLLRVPVRYVPAPPAAAIMNQFQNFNIGADLYNGGIIA